MRLGLRVKTRCLWMITMLFIWSIPFGSGSPAQAAMGQLNVRMVDDINDLDPARIRTTEDQSIGFSIYSRLVKYSLGKFAAVEPDLAERWEISNDGKVYTFFLRKGVKWQRGYGEVTADDVKFSLDRLTDTKTGSLYLNQASVIDRVQVVNKYEVRVSLKRSYSGFLVEFLAYRPGFIVNAKAMRDFGNRYTANAVGSGPFIFDRWEPGARVVLKANPDFSYGPKPKMVQVNLAVMKEDPLFEISLQKGDIDIGYMIDPDIQERIIKSKDIRTIFRPAPQTMYVMINTMVKPWNDVRVRKALWYATDRQGIIDGVFHGLAQISDTLLNPYVFGYVGKTMYRYDLNQARMLLQEAGYPNGFETEFFYYQPEGWPKQAPALQGVWKRVGIAVTLRQFEVAQLYERYRQKAFSLGGNAVMRVGPDQIFSILLHSASIPFPNAMQYANPEVDSLIDGARAELNDSKRAEMYRRIQEKVWEDIPVIPLYQPKLVLAMRPAVKGAVIPGLQAFNLADIEKTNP